MMRQRKEWWFAEQTIDKNSPAVGYQKTLEPAHLVNGKGLAAAQEVHSEWSHDQQGTLLQLSDANTWVLSYRSGVRATLSSSVHSNQC